MRRQVRGVITRIEPAPEIGGTLGRSLFFLQAPFPLNSFDLFSQPSAESFFHFDLAAGAIEILHRQAIFGERNKAAGNTLCTLGIGHKLLQQAFLARMRPRGVAEIRADRRILKNRRSTPWRMRRPSITSIFQKAQLELQDLQNVAIVLSHRAPQLRLRMTDVLWKLRASRHQEL